MRLIDADALEKEIKEKDIMGGLNYRWYIQNAPTVDVLDQKGMIITKTCNTCEHYPNDKHCIGCEWDKDKKENTKWELNKNPIAIERKVLEQIRAEIQENINYNKKMNY